MAGDAISGNAREKLRRAKHVELPHILIVYCIALAAAWTNGVNVGPGFEKIAGMLATIAGTNVARAKINASANVNAVDMNAK